MLIGLFAGIVAALLAGLIPRWVRLEPRPKNRWLQSAIIIAASTALGWALHGDLLEVVLSAALLCGAMIDIEHMVLPVPLTLGGAALALAASPFRPLGWQMSLAGVVMAFVVTFVPHFIYARIRKQSGQGVGDLHLALLIGAWLGPAGIFVALFAAAIQSILVAVLMRVTGLRYPVPASVRAEIDALRKRAATGDADAKRELDADPMAAEGTGILATRLPFGPFLALGAIEARFVGKVALAWLLP